MTAQPLHAVDTDGGRRRVCRRCGDRHTSPEPGLTPDRPERVSLVPQMVLLCEQCSLPLSAEPHRVGEPCPEWDMSLGDPLYAMANELVPKADGTARIPRGPVQSHLTIVPDGIVNNPTK